MSVIPISDAYVHSEAAIRLATRAVAGVDDAEAIRIAISAIEDLDMTNDQLTDLADTLARKMDQRQGRAFAAAILQRQSIERQRIADTIEDYFVLAALAGLTLAVLFGGISA